MEPSSIRYPYYDEWKYSGSGSGDKSTQWGLCSYKVKWDRPNILECEKCKNDWADSIIIDRAEKGTRIFLSEHSDFYAYSAYTYIDILKNFDKYSSSVEEKYRQGIWIRSLSPESGSNTDNKYFKLTYVKKGNGFWPLDQEVSNVRVYFDHRDPTKH